MTPPSVSMPSDSGVTSSSTTSFTSPAMIATLNGGADRHHFVRVDPLVRLLVRTSSRTSPAPSARASNRRPARLRRSRSGLSFASASALLHRLAAALDQRVDQPLELGARDRHLQVLGAAGVGRDERQIDVGGLRRREFLLGLFGGFAQPLQRHRVLAQVDAVARFLNLSAMKLISSSSKSSPPRCVSPLVLSTSNERRRRLRAPRRRTCRRPGRTRRSFRPSSSQAVGQRGGRRLVDDALDFQAGNLPGVLRRLPLGVVEVRRHGDDRLVDLVAEVALGGFLQLAQDLRGDFRRRVLLVADLDLHVVVRPADDLVRDHLLFGLDLAVPAAHEPLDRVDRSAGVRDGLPLGRLADQNLPLVGERHDAGRQPIAFLVGDDLHLAPFHDRDDGVRRAQINPDNSSHRVQPCRLSCSIPGSLFC